MTDLFCRSKYGWCTFFYESKGLGACIVERDEDGGVLMKDIPNPDEHWCEKGRWDRTVTYRREKARLSETFEDD